MHALVAINNLKVNIEARVRNQLPENMSVQQFMLLTAIYNLKSPSCEQVCEEVGLIGPSVSRMITQLKKGNLIKDKVCDADKRIKRLSVTTEGGKFYRKYKNRVQKALHVDITDLKDVAAIITNKQQ